MPELDREALFDRVAKAYRKKRRSKGAANSAPAKQAHAKYTQRKEPVSKRQSVHVEAAAAVLSGLPEAAATSALAADFVGYWWAAGGPAFALKALVRMWAYELDYDGSLREPKDDRYRFRKDPDRFGPWVVMRRYLAACDQVTYDGAAREAATLREQAKGMTPAALSQRAMTSFLFPTQKKWVYGDVRLFLKLHRQNDLSYWERHGYCLLAAATTREELQAIVERATMVNFTRGQGWLAFLPTAVDSLGPEAFEFLRDATVDAHYTSVAKASAEAISAIVSPDVASWFARKLADSGSPQADSYQRRNAKIVAGIATAYLKRHPDIAMPALRAVASRKKTAKKALTRLLSSLEAEQGASPREASATEAPVIPKTLERAWTKIPKKKLPSFWPKGALPSLRLHEGGVLPDDLSDGLGKALMVSTPSKPHAAVVAVVKACDLDTLSDWALVVFDAWIETGAPSAHKWALMSLAHFGGDAAARRLAPLMIRWPSEGAYARARLALDVLSCIETDVGNLYLERVWERATTEKFRQDLAAARKARAAARRVSPRELTDLMPDLGLDEQSRRRLDYGPRAFHVGFDRHLKPFVLDDAGTRLRRLPSPRTGDDPSLAASAARLWEAMKTDAEVLASLHLKRLEDAMCLGWSWSAGAFEKKLVRHPLIGLVARNLVWEARSKKGKTLWRFRVAGDGSFADVEDETVKLPRTAEVGLKHPLELDDDELTSWRALFSEYELIQPVPQLERKVFRVTPEEKNSKSIDRVDGKKTTMAKIRALFRYGWGGEDSYSSFDLDSLDSIYAVHISRPVRGTPYRVTIRVDEKGRFECADLVEGSHWGFLKHHAFGAIGPIAFSEIVRELDSAT